MADAPTLGLPTLGADADLALYGLQGTQTLNFPVPAGLTPAELTATVELPPNVTAGSIAVTQDNRTVSRVDLPPDRAPISIPLAGAEVVDNAVTVLLRSQLLPPAGYCLYDTAIPLRLVNAAVVYTGRETPPQVVADFLPPVLERLTIYVPESPSRAESDAAVRLTTAVVARYGEQRTDVDVEALRGDAMAPPTPSGPFERNIVVREGPNAAVSLQGTDGVPALLITGPANDLLNQARLLSSDLSQLALASKAVAGPIKSSPQLPGNETTIRELGQPGVNATALKPQVTVGLDQTRLGRPVKGVRVHLKGSYTPLPASLGGQVVASVNGQTVDRWPIDASGAIDRWVDVPDELLQRYTNLGVAVDLSGNTGRCGEFQPVTLTIDGATTVETTQADPPVPAGFQSLPQAVMPRMLVGLGADFADTRRAVAIAEGLQRLSALPIDTEVVSVDDALATQSPALVVAADGWPGDRPELPVSSAADGELDVDRLDGERTTLRLDPGLRFGSLQTVSDDNRTVLVATSNGDAGELDSLLGWLDGDSRRWARLSGVAVIAPAGEEPVTVAGESPATDQAADTETKPAATLWLGAGATVAAAAALIGWLLLRRRRRA
ncbi:cellulose synthase subunit [Mycolicibacterium rutilum]|uniref:Cellulose synthase subunit n=1 Tax=Mycolicibacterium rutilum TaxID=370526 RepID=A0A1H6M382_MYCRU|nr:cellulose synthase subunit [Mycolicibacterium rutilum]